MSEIQKKWRCEKCFGLYDTRKKAVECAASHVHEEVWVMCGIGLMIWGALRRSIGYEDRAD